MLLFDDVVSADGDRSLGAAVRRLLCLPDPVVNALPLAGVAVALGADFFEAGLLTDKLFELGDECAGLLFDA